MGLGYWILTKSKKMIIAEKDLETCAEEARDNFSCDMRAREALLSTLLDIKYNQ